MLYAYLRSLAPPQSAFTPLYIPVLNVPSSDIRLRPEFLALFKHANITSEHIIGLDDLPASPDLQQKLPPGNTRWILVDHNSLQHELGAIYGSRVQGVIDHHEEENSVPIDTDPEPRVLEKAGSCTSLIVRTFRTEWQATSDSSVASGAAHAQGDSLANDSHLSILWDAQLAKLALGSILIDTSNLTSQYKVTATDVEAVRYLEAKICLQDGRWDRKAFYQELNTAKKNVDAFEVKDILRKDYKRWTEKDGRMLGIASVIKPLDFLATKATEERNDDHGMERIIQEIMEAQQLSMYAIMTNSRSPTGGRKRELLLQSVPSATAIREGFNQRFNEALQLESMDVHGICQGDKILRNIWIQKDVSKSRKQVAPLLREAMNAA